MKRKLDLGESQSESGREMKEKSIYKQHLRCIPAQHNKELPLLHGFGVMLVFMSSKAIPVA
jgi:hypothetical protein